MRLSAVPARPLRPGGRLGRGGAAARRLRRRPDDGHGQARQGGRCPGAVGLPLLFFLVFVVCCVFVCVCVCVCVYVCFCLIVCNCVSVSLCLFACV